jgi:23S rRNA (uracil1939-C5)-methyltransferase
VANFYTPKTKKQQINHDIRLHIDRLDINGVGVGLYRNKPVFVENTLPDEIVSVRVIEQKNKYSRAKLLAIESASDKRVRAKCLHSSQCGGCDLQHLTFSAHVEVKKNKVNELFARNGITSLLPWQMAIVSEPWHYRRKARIGVQYDKIGDATIGFRQKATNKLVQIKQCTVLVEPLAAIFVQLKSVLASLSGKKAIGHIEVVATEQITLAIRQLVPLSIADKSLWLAAAEQHQWQIFIDDGAQVFPLHQVKPLQYCINNNIQLTFKIDHFIQVNHHVNKLMVEQALDWLSITNKDNVLDLFCGLGNFSLPMAQRVNKVVGVEGVNNMVLQADDNARANSIKNCRFYQADLNSDWQTQEWAKQSFDKVLLDPARAGAYQALEQVIALSIKQVLYVSCDPTSLAKDSALLLRKGYKITKIGLIDMFAQTKHVETMVLFTAG